MLALLLLLALAMAACGTGDSIFGTPTGSPTPWPPGASPSPAITYPPQTGTTEDFKAGIGGWPVKPVVDVTVTELGFYDDGQDGLLKTRRVGIFDSSDEKLLVEVQVHPQSPLDGVFRWEPITPLVLKAEHTYAVVSSNGMPWDPEVLYPKRRHLAPELRCVGYYEHWAKQGGGGWAYPGTSRSHFYLTGNFKFKPVSAP